MLLPSRPGGSISSFFPATHEAATSRASDTNISKFLYDAPSAGIGAICTSDVGSDRDASSACGTSRTSRLDPRMSAIGIKADPIYPETGSNPGDPALSSAGRCMRRFCHPKREKSLVAVRSDFAGNSGDISKAEFRFDIWQFESSRVSQPVPSLGLFPRGRKTSDMSAA
jgi:hypothetical protein